MFHSIGFSIEELLSFEEYSVFNSVRMQQTRDFLINILFAHVKY